MDRVLQHIIDMLIKLEQLDAELAIPSARLESTAMNRESAPCHPGGAGKGGTNDLPAFVQGEDGSASNQIRDGRSRSEGGQERKHNES